MPEPDDSDAPEWESGASETSAEHNETQSQDSEAKPPRQSQASEVVTLALDRFDLGVSEDGQPFGVPKRGASIVRQFRGGRRSLRAELSAAYRAEHGRVPSASALSDALTTLEGEAAVLPPRALHLRVARHGEKIVLDLGDETGRVVVVGPVGWRVKRRSPVLFARTELTMPLPEPQPNGSLDDLREILNVTDLDWDVLVAFLVAALVPEVPHPILLLTGEQGTAKTTTEKFLGRLIDPSPAETRQAPRDIEQWSIAAAGSYVVPLDNLSWLPPWLSDALCRACTGEGSVRRRLYTDGGLMVLKFRRVVILNTIDAGALRGDLAERLVLVELDRISEDNRRLDSELDQVFRAMHPLVLGALLDLLSETLAELPNVSVERLPRMADFARIVWAVDRVRGTNAFSTYLSTGHRIAAEVIEGDAVALAVEHFMSRRRRWRGTAQELLDELTEPERAKHWPSDAQRLGARLKRAAVALRSRGIDYEIKKATTSDRTRFIVLTNTSAPKKEKRRKSSSARSGQPRKPKKSDRLDDETRDFSGSDVVRVTCGRHTRNVPRAKAGKRCTVIGCELRTHRKEEA